MATVAETIDKVTSFTSRFDLADQLQSYFKSALQSAHKIERFRQDLATVNLVDPVILAGKVQASVPMQLPGLRDVRNIELFSSYITNMDLSISPGVQIPVCSPGYQDLNTLLSDKDYFGYKYRQLYSRAGNTLNILGVDTSTKLIQVQGLFYPTYEMNILTGEWESNSFLLDEASELIEAYLRYRVAEIQDDTKKLQIAQLNIQNLRREVITAYSNDLLGEHHVN